MVTRLFLIFNQLSLFHTCFHGKLQSCTSACIVWTAAEWCQRKKGNNSLFNNVLHGGGHRCKSWSGVVGLNLIFLGKELNQNIHIPNSSLSHTWSRSFLVNFQPLYCHFSNAQEIGGYCLVFFCCGKRGPAAASIVKGNRNTLPFRVGLSKRTTECVKGSKGRKRIDIWLPSKGLVLEYPSTVVFHFTFLLLSLFWHVSLLLFYLVTHSNYFVKFRH